MCLKSRIMIVVLSLALGFLGAVVLSYGYLVLNARALFNQHMSLLTKRTVKADRVQAIFPSGILVDGLSVQGVFDCRRVRVDVDISSLFGRHMSVRRLEFFGLEFFWKREAGPVLSRNVSPERPRIPEAEVDDLVPTGVFGAVKTLIVDQVVVHDGVVRFVFPGMGQRVIEHVQLTAEKVPLTDMPAMTKFFATASLEKSNVPFMGHFLKAEGWVNWAARDMEAAVQMVDDDGRVGLQAKLSSRQNDMAVFGTLDLLGDQAPQAVGEKEGLMENVVLSGLLSTKTDVRTDFSFRTRMDRFEIEKIRLSGQITTGLNSWATSGNIVAGLKAVSEELLRSPLEEEVVE